MWLLALVSSTVLILPARTRLGASAQGLFTETPRKLAEMGATEDHEQAEMKVLEAVDD